MYSDHVSVLLNECIDNLCIKPDGVYVDGTTGLGGHSFEIASRLDSGRLICIDRDESSLNRAAQRLSRFGDRVSFIHSNFSHTADLLRGIGIGGVDGLLFDLGVSSPQLDEVQRGFSYMQNASLDMRMDKDSSITAYDIINSYSESDLISILFDYGEEKYARRIAAGISKAREKKPIESTFELVDVIKTSLPAQALKEKQHPAKRSFQAIRIAVNDELGEISKMMDTVPFVMNVGARLCVISFHSLEDRIVKTKISQMENGCTCPKEFPICRCGFVQILKKISKKPIIPSSEELEANPRSRSAKLRVAERV